MKEILIQNRSIGKGHPCYVIAEVSCNHEGNIEEAKRIMDAAIAGGADAIKIQTYTANTMTRAFENKAEDTIWADIDLHKLYEKAQTPWDWTFSLKAYAEERGVHFFSSPFDETAVDFLVDEVGVPCLKVASFEVVDTKLLEKMAKTGLPVIMSNGMTDFLEMTEAVETLRKHGCKDLAILHCNSGYPAAFKEANLKTMQVISNLFEVPVGVSDHTLFADHEKYERPLAHIAPVEAVRMGASIVEVHITSDRDYARTLFEKNEGGFDWPFSMNPDEFKTMVDMIRHFEATNEVSYDSAEQAEIAQLTHGTVCFDPTEKEKASRKVRPSLWLVKDVKKGEKLRFAAEDKEGGNFDSIRPGGGLHVRFTDLIDGAIAAYDCKAGTPVSWELVE